MLNSKTLMIVLADHDRRVRLRKMCEERFGLTVHSAANPMEGLALLQKLPPPGFILLSSEPLALMTREEFLTYKSRIPEMKQVPVILLSIKRVEQLPTGVAEEVLGPISEERLEKLIHKYCEIGGQK